MIILSHRGYWKQVDEKNQTKDLIKIIPFYFVKRYFPSLAVILKKLYFKIFVNKK